MWYIYALSKNIFIIEKKKKTCLQIFFDRYECVGLFMYLRLEVASGSSLDVHLTGHEEKALATESPRWQSTRNLLLPRVPSPTIPLKVFR